MKKVKILEINDYDYTLFDGKVKWFKNIEIYSNHKLKVNDIVYISEKILEEDNLLAFTDVFQDNIIETDDIIKVVSNKDNYYLQRIYG